MFNARRVYTVRVDLCGQKLLLQLLAPAIEKTLFVFGMGVLEFRYKCVSVYKCTLKTETRVNPPGAEYTRFRLG